MKEVIRQHWATFYRYDTGVKTAVWPRYVLLAVIAILATIFARGGIKDFGASAISVLSIFVGFSFALLFFIVDEKSKSPVELDEGSGALADGELEEEVKNDKLIRLRREIFYNLSYFNFVSFVAVVFLLGHSFSISKGLIGVFGIELEAAFFTYVAPVGMALAFFFVFDALASFYRVVRRITFYFTETYGEGVGNQPDSPTATNPPEPASPPAP
ncbi:hypothetical protein K3162_10115 [Qipengyuania xiapuensis]|uniref:Uncharacterized protein n=1 Tax=Qipengyuania xiapuensis TaxID=2867236 RepID=A0ABX8ZVN2_9SPHN|nr:hypothetical protein [Qipengyuania xiapuensis]QZD91904.1 hypothetical protein K3162_10115 [Qipengyuania xiapuensis]